MTPLDQTLVDQIKTALSKSAPEFSKNIVIEPKDPSQQKVHLKGGVYARLHGNRIMLTVERDNLGPYQIIELLPEQFQALNEFAVKIGWQCD